MPNVTLRVVNDALLDAPVFERHERGKNWLAVIDVNPAFPGGLSRDFAPYGRGDCLYSVAGVELFAAVEFAADYTTSAGRKRQNRWYGVVVAKTEESMVVEQCDTGVNAVVRARDAKRSPDDRARALEAELLSCEARAAALRKEIEVIRGPAAEEVRA